MDLSLQQLIEVLYGYTGLKADQKHAERVSAFAESIFTNRGLGTTTDARITLEEEEKKRLSEQFAADFAAYLSALPPESQTFRDYLLAKIATEKEEEYRQQLIELLASTPDEQLQATQSFLHDTSTGRIVERFSIDSVRSGLAADFPELSQEKREEIMAALQAVGSESFVTAEHISKALTDAIPAEVTDRQSFLLRAKAESYALYPRSFLAAQSALQALQADPSNAAALLSGNNDLYLDGRSEQVMITKADGTTVPFSVDELKAKADTAIIPEVGVMPTTAAFSAAGLSTADQAALITQTRNLHADLENIRAGLNDGKMNDPEFLRKFDTLFQSVLTEARAAAAGGMPGLTETEVAQLQKAYDGIFGEAIRAGFRNPDGTYKEGVFLQSTPSRQLGIALAMGIFEATVDKGATLDGTNNLVTTGVKADGIVDIREAVKILTDSVTLAGVGTIRLDTAGRIDDDRTGLEALDARLRAANAAANQAREATLAMQ